MSKPKTLKEIEEMIGKVNSADDIREVMRSWNIILENFEAIQTHLITKINRNADLLRKLIDTRKDIEDDIERLRSDVDFILAGKVKLVKNGSIIVEEPKKTVSRGIE